MLLFANIRAEVERNWDELEASQYPEDLLVEWADSQVPVYNSDIYNLWGSLPAEAQDEWAFTGVEVSSETTILELMRLDIFLYVEIMYRRAYDEVLAEKETI